MKPWTSSRPLTAGEHNGLALIKLHHSLYGQFPSLREIAEHLGAKDKTTAARIVQTLKRRKLIGAAT